MSRIRREAPASAERQPKRSPTIIDISPCSPGRWASPRPLMRWTQYRQRSRICQFAKPTRTTRAAYARGGVRPRPFVSQAEGEVLRRDHSPVAQRRAEVVAEFEAVLK